MTWIRGSFGSSKQAIKYRLRRLSSNGAFFLRVGYTVAHMITSKLGRRAYHNRRQYAYLYWWITTLVLIPVRLQCLAEAPTATVRLEVVVEGLEAPLDFADPGDSTGRLFVVEKPGRVRVIKDGKLQRRPLLDLEDYVSEGAEQGLLGIALAPDFPASKKLYLNFTDRQGDTVVARYIESTNGRGEGKDLQVILKIVQPFANHNGGQIRFGSDTFLYIGMGDGGGAGDPGGHAQNKRSLLGKMLRIDPSPPTGYQIPRDNPFVSDRDAAPEVWALGFRNPWRFSFDRESGKLFVGDVGQSAQEEVDIVERGGNYGWNSMEGSVCFGSVECDSTRLVAPIAHYGRDEGVSVIGGYVYRGSALPDLKGKYVFGDFGTGTIWTLTASEDGRSWQRQRLIATGKRLTGFGEDRSGELFVMTLDGVLYRLTLPAAKAVAQ
jgi:glucose/arabinose dehydrogenase